MLGVGRGAFLKKRIKENVVTTKIGVEAHRRKVEAGVEVKVASLDEDLLGMNGAGQEAALKKEVGGTAAAAGLEGAGVVRVESCREVLSERGVDMIGTEEAGLEIGAEDTSGIGIVDQEAGRETEAKGTTEIRGVDREADPETEAKGTTEIRGADREAGRKNLIAREGMYQEVGPERGGDVTTKRVGVDRKVGHLEGGVGTRAWMMTEKIEAGQIIDKTPVV